MTKLTSQEIVDLSKEYTFFSWSVQGQVSPIPVARAEGIYFWDTDGKRYIDFSSQLMNTNIGHQHPKVVKAIQDQAAEVCFVHPGNTTEVRALLGKKLSEVTPGNLKKTFFALGGSEANENAIKIARFYTGRHKILARYRSYHGATHGALALTGDYRRLPAEPTLPGVIHFLDPYCYRCPFGWTKETCHRECISHVEEVIQHEGPDQIAAIFLEGVTGTNGLIIPPDEYWPRMREICDKYGILLISDEVMSGWGRTGKWFAIEHAGVAPDVLVVGKALGGGLPLSAVICRADLTQSWTPSRDSSTLAGNPVACAAALATIGVVKSEKLIDNAAAVGAYFLEGLRALSEEFPLIGDVRGVGLMLSVELVKNRGTKEPLMGSGRRIAQLCLKRGLLIYPFGGHFGNVFAFLPPLIIDRSHVDTALGLVRESLSEYRKEAEAAA